MAREMNWKCHQCNMVFQNPALLQKHRDRFCVGIGDPDELLLRRPQEHRPASPLENDPPRYNPNSDPKLQQLAESHGRNMEYLSNRNRDLERQRDEIRRRLEELGRRPIKGDDSTAALLQELRDQEARNRKLLEELRRQLMEARGPINIIQQGEERKQGKSFTYPIYYGNSLVAEITAIRQAYLQNGGADPDILAQMSQMQAEAQAIEDAMRNAQVKTKVKDKRDPGITSLTTLELENERLQRELLLLQEQKFISRDRRKDEREGRARATLYEHGQQETSFLPVHPPSHPHLLPSQPHLLPPSSSPAALEPSSLYHPYQRQVPASRDSYLLSSSFPGPYGLAGYGPGAEVRFNDRDWWMLQQTYRPAPVDRPASAPSLPKLTIRELDGTEDAGDNPPAPTSKAGSARPTRGAREAPEHQGGPEAPEEGGEGEDPSEKTALQRRGRRDRATRSLWAGLPEGETIIPDDGEPAEWWQEFERVVENNNWSGKRPRPPTKRVPRPRAPAAPAAAAK